MTPPCGVPETVWLITPSSITSAVSHCRTSFCTRRSDTRSPTNSFSRSWSSESKKWRMSNSTTQVRPSGYERRMTSSAAVALRLGR